MLTPKSISFSCNLSNLSVVRDFIRQELSNFNLNKILENQIILAVDEVCANLIIHSNQNDDSKFINLDLSIKNSPKGIVIEFKENGIPFDYSKYQEPQISNLKETKTSGKMGMMLVRRIMDEIEYLHFEDYNICRLFKSIA